MPATKTDLLDRYLQAVKFWLPKAQQQDIIAELAEDLQSQMEEREATLGHPPGEDDLVQILRKRGAPMKVASSYLPDQRLINPALLPVYRLVLKIVLLWVLAPLFAIVFIGPLFTSGRPWGALVVFLNESWRTGFSVVGLVTTVFALFDRYHVKIKNLDYWDPRKLPRVPAAQDTRTRWNHLASFIFGVLALSFWAYLMWQRSEISFPGGPRVILEPVWKYVYWPVIGLTLAGAAMDLLSSLRPSWSQARSRARIGLDACMLIVVAVLLKAGSLVEIVSPNLSTEDLAKATTWIVGSIRLTLLCVALIVIGDAIAEIRRLLRGGPARPAAIPTM